MQTPVRYRALFVNMPFGGLDRPALGVSLLKSRLARLGIPSDVAYFNIRFAEIIGRRLYEIISNTGNLDTDDGIPYTVLGGEWLFSQHFHGPGSLDAGRYIEEVLRPNISARAIQSLLGIRPAVGPFLEECMGRVDWSAYDFVGFTSTFEQNMASLCLARMIKRRHPHLFIAMGGANCEGVMGQELLRQYDFIDAVCTGEGDNAVPELLGALRAGGSPAGIKGLAWRDGSGSCHDSGPADLVRDMDALAVPDFDDYFAQLGASRIRGGVVPWLQLEGSRGCWWGAKSHCTFCGLNGRTLEYRRKSGDRLLSELFHLVYRYGIDNVSFVDNILDHEGLRTFVPALARSRRKLRIFFETKSNMKRDQLALLARAGITDVQPGIESFSTPVLRLMGKGVTALQNVAFLKWSAECGVRPLWNLLYGFPLEDPAEYPKQLELLERVTHLEPPSTICTIRLDRFSPNHNRAEHFGFTNVRPMRPYHHVYPLKTEILSNLCYFFDFDYRDGRDPKAYTRDLVRFFVEWTQRRPSGTLVHHRYPDGSGLLEDTRFNRRLDRLPLDVYQNAVYEICEQPRTLRTILSLLGERFPGRPFEAPKVSAFLDYLYEHHMMVREDGSHLSVALGPASAGQSGATTHLTAERAVA